MEGIEQPHHNNGGYVPRDEEVYVQAEDEKLQISDEPLSPASIICQFCGKSFEEVPRLFEAKRRVRDPNSSSIMAVWICNECIARMTEILTKEPPGTRTLWWWQAWLPGGPMRA